MDQFHQTLSINLQSEAEYSFTTLEEAKKVKEATIQYIRFLCREHQEAGRAENFISRVSNDQDGSPELRESGSFARGILVLWVAQIAFFGTQFLIPQFLQNVRGYSAFEAGLIMLPYELALGAVMQLAGRLFDKFGVRWLAIIGIALLAIAGFLLSRASTDTGIGAIILPIIVLGFGTGLCSSIPAC